MLGGLDEASLTRLAALDEAALQKVLGSALKGALEESSDVLLAALRRTMSAAVERNRDSQATFETRLRERWQAALDLFEAIMITAREAGEHFNTAHRPQATAANDLVFEVLVRLHARACLTASEVLALLTSGHATGAHARWRTVHELAVVAYLIKGHGRDLAERYLLHEGIEVAKAAEEYQRYSSRLGNEPYTPAEMAAYRDRRAALRQRFGEPFDSQFGWAATVLNNNKPNFTDLERAAQIDHLRPHYRMASHGIHSNVKGITFNLGIQDHRTLMLAGPSDAGLADPGHSTLISLYQCTVCLLTLRPDIRGLMTLQAMGRLVDEAGQAFLTAHERLERDIATDKQDHTISGAGV